jgi:hypothetical protein
MRIYEAIDAAAQALKSGAHPNIVRLALLSDGIPATKVDVIIGWASQTKPDAEALEEAVLAGCPDCSGAMHHATMSACMFIAKNGWNKFTSEMKKRG